MDDRFWRRWLGKKRMPKPLNRVKPPIVPRVELLEVRLAPAGDFGFAVPFSSGGGSDAGRAVATDASGNVYVTGQFQGTADFDPGAGATVLSAVQGDVFVAKYTPTGALDWVRQLGGAQSDQGNGIAVDVSGNVLITGFFAGAADFDPGAGTFNLTSVYQSTGIVTQDIFVCKLDSAGNFVWARQFGGTATDQANAITVDGSGNVFTTGYFAGTVDFDPGAGTSNLSTSGSGPQDVFVSKLDSAGNFVWARRLGGTSNDQGIGIALDGSGNVLTTGLFAGTADFDPGSGTSNLTSAGDNDIFVSKLDGAGNFVWARRLGGTSIDQGNGIATDASGNVFTTGFFFGTADFDPGAGTNNLTSHGDIFVSKLDSDGNFAWARQFGGQVTDQGQAIAVDASGNVLTTGFFQGIADFDPGAGTSNLTSAGGSTDVVVLKLDNAGNFIWARQFSGTAADSTATDNGLGIAVDSSGNVATTGFFAGTADFDPGAGTSTLISAGGSRDVFLSKLDSAGNFSFAVAVGAPKGGTESGRAVATDVAGNVYVTGSFQGTIDFDPGPGVSLLTSAASAAPGANSDSRDVFVVKLDSAGNLVWARRFGGTFNIQVNGIAVDGSGNVFTTGYFQATVDFDPGAGTSNLTCTAGFQDVFVSKLDTAGDFVWARLLGGASNDQGIGIAVDVSGNVLTTGFFQGTADFDPGAGTSNLTSAGSQDVFVSKLDGAGNFVWARQLGGTSNEQGNSIAVDGSGNVLTTGFFQGTADFDPGAGTSNLTSAGFQDVFVSKLDGAGNFVWARQLGGTSIESGLGIAVDGSGNVHTTGFFYGPADFDPGAAISTLTSGLENVFVSKLDSAGNFVWARQLGGTSSDQGNGIAVDGSGNVLTTGSFSGTGDFDPGAGTSFLSDTNPGQDVFVSKLDSAGDFVWARRIGGTSSDQGNGIAVDGSGNVLTTGFFQGTADFDPGSGTFSLAPLGTQGAFVSKLNDAPPPTLTNLSPAAGKSAGGDTVVISGTSFLGATSVTFGGVNAASYTIHSATQITAVAPAGSPGTVNVVVTSPVGSSSTAGTQDDFTYVPPTVVSINRIPPTAATSASIVNYEVTFSQPVTGVDGSDFKVAASNVLQAGAPIVVSGSGTTYTIAIGAVRGAGDLRLDLIDDDSIVASGVPLGGPGARNGSFQGQSYSITLNPSFVAPTVQSIVRSSPTGQATTAGTLVFSVAFSEPVTGVDLGDFQLAFTGTATGSLNSITAQSSSSYLVTVTGAGGLGQIGLNLVDNGTIRDADDNALANGFAGVGPLSLIGTGSGPTNVASADFDRDGKLDLVSVGSMSIRVMIGNGDGTFKTGVTYATPIQGDHVRVEDVNGDGKADVLALYRYTSGISIVLGNGDGTFQAALSTAAAAAGSLGTGDVNGDGKTDLVINRSGQNVLAIKLGNGNGTFGPETTHASTGSNGLVVADVNNDQRADIVVSGNPTRILLGNGDGTFNAAFTLANSFSLEPAVGDLNNDGKLDLVFGTSQSSRISVSLGNGDGSFKAITTYASAAGPSNVSLADFNLDGYLDVMTPNGSSAGIFLGNGDGSFKAQVNYDMGRSARSGRVADFNGDGRPDLVTANLYDATIGVRLNLDGDFTGQTYFEDPVLPVASPKVISINRTAPAGSAASATTQTFTAVFSETVTGVGVADFQLVTTGTLTGSISQVTAVNGSTYDVTVSSISGSGTLAVKLVDDNSIRDVNNKPLVSPVPSYAAQATFGLSAAPRSLAAGDLTGDGVPDLVVAQNSTQSLGVFVGNGNGTFKPETILSTSGRTPQHVKMVDVDGDGLRDLISSTYGGTGVSVFLGNGNGTFKPRIDTNAGTSPYTFALGDVNGDGKLDVALSAGGNAGILLGNGDGSFQVKPSVSIGIGGRVIGVADFNGDGKGDIVSIGGGPSCISLILGNGDGTFKPATTFLGSEQGNNGFVADIDGDGDVDVVTSSFWSFATVFIGNGNGTFKPMVAYPTITGGIRTISPADVNGDGRLDLLVPSSYNSRLNVLVGNGDGSFLSPITFATGAAPYEAAAADFNSDGRTDLAVANNDGSKSVGVLQSLRGDFTGQAATVDQTSPTATITSQPATASTSSTASFTFTGNDPSAGGVASGVNRFEVSLDGAAFVTAMSPASFTNLADGSHQFQVRAVDNAGNVGTPVSYNWTVETAAPSLVITPNGTTISSATVTFTFTFSENVTGFASSDVTVTNAVKGTFTAVNGSTYTLVVTPSADGAVTASVAANAAQDGAGKGSDAASASVTSERAAPRVLSISRTSPAATATNASSVTYTVTFSEPVTGVDAADFSAPTTGAVSVGVPQVSGSDASYTVTIPTIAGNGTVGLNVLNDGSILDLPGNALVLAPVLFQPFVATAPGMNSNGFATGDFNIDGKSDIVFGNIGAGAGSYLGLLYGNGDGTFQATQPIASTASISTAYSADFNGDGFADIATYRDIAAIIVLGNGNGTYKAAQSFTLPGSTSGLAIGDVSGDGKPDIVAASNAGRMSTLIGNGDGTFKPAVTYSNQSSSRVVMADFDDDQVNDVAFFSLSGASVFLNNGNGTFKPRTTFSADVQEVAAADVDRDGNVDLVTINGLTSSNRQQWLGNGNGTFRAPTSIGPASVYFSVQAGDLNGDAISDLAFASATTINVLIGNGNGTYRAEQTFASGGDPNPFNDNFVLRLADVSGDSRLDLVLADIPQATFRVLLNAGNSDPVGPTYLVDQTPPMLTISPNSATTNASTMTFTFAFGENVTGFDASDVVVTNGTKGTFTAVSGSTYTLVVTPNGDGAVTANVAANAAQDAVGNGNVAASASVTSERMAPSVVSIVRTTPAAATTNATSLTFTVTFSEAVTGVDPADFSVATTGVIATDMPQVTGGGTTYLVTIPSVAGSGTVGLNLADNGSIRDLAGLTLSNASHSVGFAPFLRVVTGVGSLSVPATDFDSDGILDVIVVENISSLGTIAVYRGNGDGTFKAPLVTNNPANAQKVLTFDANNDGKADLLQVNDAFNVAGMGSVMLGNGNGTFKAPQTFGVEVNPADFDFGDFNGDGKLDVVVGADGIAISIHLGNGDGAFKPRTSYANGREGQIKVGDVNGDGFLDVVAGNAVDGAISVFLGNGDGSFKPRTTFSAVNSGMALADVNADGKIDVLSTDFNNKVYQYLGNGNGTFGAATTFSSLNTPNAIRVADMNRDGRLDLVVGKNRAGAVAVFIGNGNGTYLPEATFAVGDWVINDALTIADVNGDGRPDVVTGAWYTPRTFHVLLNSVNGDTTGPTYTVDQAAPTTSIVARPPALSLDTSTSFSFTASDLVVGGLSSGLNRTEYSLDGSAYAPAASPIGFTGLANGPHIFSVRAVDNVGNVSSLATATWTIDSSAAPSVASIQRQNPVGQFTNGSTVSYTVVFNGPVSGVDAADFVSTNTGTVTTPGTPGIPGVPGVPGIPGRPAIPATPGTPGIPATPGTPDIPATPGNPELGIPPTPFIPGTPGTPAIPGIPGTPYIPAVPEIPAIPAIPEVPPVPAISVSGSGTTYVVTISTIGGNGTLRLDLVDDDSIVSTINGLKLGGAGAGNGNANGPIYVSDRTIPTASISSTPPSTTASGSASFAFSGLDATVGGVASGVARLEYQLDAATDFISVTGDSGIASFTGLSIGSHAFRVRAVDAAGNVGAMTTYTWTVDRTSPSVTAINRSSPSASVTNAGSVTYAVTFSEAVTGVNAADFAVDVTGGISTGTPQVSGSGASYSVTLPSVVGSGTITLRLVDDSSIRDLAGNLLYGSTSATFSAPQTYATGTGSDSVAVADYNSDGKLDVALIENLTASRIAIVFGNGNGTFTAPQTYASLGGASNVQTADVNLDGKADLVFVGSSEGRLGVMLGNGNGTFKPTQTFQAESGAWLALGDVNNDGKPDAVVSSGNLVVLVLMGNGDGTFKPRVAYQSGGASVGIALADVNNDGSLDITASTNENGVSLFLNNGDGIFKPRTTMSANNAQGITYADVNGDGNQDLFVTNYGSSVYQFLGNGNGTFKTPTTIVNGTRSRAVQAGDLTGDGKIDLVVGEFLGGPQVGVFAGNGDGTFKPRQTLALLDVSAVGLALADITNDGRLDIVAAAKFNARYFGAIVNVNNGNFTGQTYVIDQTSHWIGGAGANGNLWSVASNWLENAVPRSGFVVVLDTTTAGFTTTSNGFNSVNDLAPLSNVTITINDASSAGDFHVSGATIGLTASGVASAVTVGAAAEIALPLALPAATTLTVSSGALTVSGALGGSGALAKAGTGSLKLGGDNSSYAGAIAVNSGTLVAANAHALGTVAAGTTVVAGATLVLSGGIALDAEPISIGGAGGGAGALQSVAGANTATGPITLTADSTVGAPSAADSLTIAGNVQMAQFGVTVAGAGNTSISGAMLAGQASGIDASFYTAPGNVTLLDSASAFPGINLQLPLYVPVVTALTPTIDFGAGTESSPGNGSVLDRSGTSGNPLGGIGVNLGTTNVEALWSGKIQISEEADYRFTSRNDDGATVYVDGMRVVYSNVTQSMANTNGSVRLTAGLHEILIGWYQGIGPSGMQLSWERTSGSNQFTRQIVPSNVLYNDVATPGTFVSGGLKGQYFNATAVSSMLESQKKLPIALQNTALYQPATTTITPTIDFGSGTESSPGNGSVLDRSGTSGNPLGGIGVNLGTTNVEALWTGKIQISEEADYRFTIRNDDGATLFVDDTRVAHKNATQTMANTNGIIHLTPGLHSILVGWYQGVGPSGMQLSWERVSGANQFARQIVPSSVLFNDVASPGTLVVGGLKGQYFNATAVSSMIEPLPQVALPMNLQALTPAAQKVVSYVDFGAGTETVAGTGNAGDRNASTGNILGGIGVNLGTTNVAAYFTGQFVAPQAGLYRFTTRSDDGSRLFIDGNLVVDNDLIQNIASKSGTISLTAGAHSLALGYFEGPSAPWGFQAFWERDQGGGNFTARAVLGPDVMLRPATNVVIKTGTGTLTLSGANSYTGGTTVNQGTLLVANSAGSGTGTGNVVVAAGATLGGNGTFTGSANVSGILAPGSSPGVLRTGAATFSASGTRSFDVEINGTNPGTQYDQLGVTGAVNLAGATLNVAFGYVPASGTTFVLVANDGTDPVVGTFAGLPQGATFTYVGQIFQVSYVGGSGNDVTLTATNDRPIPRVTSIVRSAPVGPYVNAPSVEYVVTFSEPVDGLDSSDFVVTRTGSVSSSGASFVALSDRSFRVTVSLVMGDGTLRLDVVDDGSITSIATGLPLGGDADGGVQGEVYSIDHTGPVATIVSAPPLATASRSATFDFSAVDPSEGGVAAGVDRFEYQLDFGGFVAGSAPVTFSGLAVGGHVFQVRAIDALGNVGAAVSHSWTVVPYPRVLSIVPNGASPTNAASVTFNVTFDASVVGVDVADFVPATTGAVSATVSNVSGGGAAYVVTVSAINGDGLLGVNLVDNGTIFGVSGAAPLGGDGPGNGDFAGLKVSIDHTGPTVTITATPPAFANSTSAEFAFNGGDPVVNGVSSGIDRLEYSLDGGEFVVDAAASVSGLAEGVHEFRVRAIDGVGNVGAVTSYSWTIDLVGPRLVSIVRAVPAGSPTSAASVTYAVTFDEPVVGVDEADFDVVASGSVTSSSLQVTGSGATYLVVVGGVAGSGALRLDLVDDDDSIADVAGNPLANRSSPGAFETSQTFSAMPGASSVTTADLDGGGALDVIETNSGANVVSVMLGNVGGGLGTPQTFAVGNFPVAVVVADVDGDGMPDLVVVDRSGAGVSLLLGNGDGTFQSQQTFGTGVRPTAAAIADVDGDGNVDVVAVNAFSNNAAVLLGNGDGTFQPLRTFGTGGLPTAVAIGDVSGDGEFDLVVVNQASRSISVLRGDGAGHFASQATFAIGASPSSLSLADVDGDRALDVVVANTGEGSIGVLLNLGDGTFEPQTTYGVGSLPRSLAVADVSGDGVLDFVVVSGGDVGVLHGSGDGTFAPQTTFAVGGSATSLSLGDVNGDGAIDVLIASDSDVGHVLFGTPAGSVVGDTYVIDPSAPLDPLDVPRPSVTSIVTGIGAAQVLDVVPFVGPTSGGTTVVLSGVNFLGVTAVHFGGAAALSYTVHSPTRITAVAPPGRSGLVDVTVTNLAGTSPTSSTADDYTYAAPAITSVVVNGGPIAARDRFGKTLDLANQSSVVTQLLVTFNQRVTLDAKAFQIVSHAGLTATGAPPSSATVAVIATGVESSGDATLGYQQYVLTFAAGAGVNSFDYSESGGTAFTTLQDGSWRLETTGSKVRAGAGLAGADTAADHSNAFWSLFGVYAAGDIIPSSDPTAMPDSVRVDGLALSHVYTAFGSRNDATSQSYTPAFDSDLDGDVDGIDLGRLYANFGAIWKF